MSDAKNREEVNKHSVGNSVVKVNLITTGAKGKVWNIGLNTIEYLYFIEDIFSYSITGKICFYDRAGLVEFAPITGNEIIEVMYGNSDDEDKYKKLRLQVYKINDLKRTSSHGPTGSAKVELILVDEYFHKWHSNRWSKAWTDTRIDTIVAGIANAHVGITKFDSFETTNEKMTHFDMHNRTPSECVSWLMNRASSSATGTPGYVLYRRSINNSDMYTHRFESIESLLSQKKMMKPWDKDTEDAIYAFESPSLEYINKIYKHKLIPVNNTALKNLAGNTLKGFDSTRKLPLKRVYKYTDAINMFTILGDRTLFPISFDQYVERPPVYIETLDDEKFMDNFWYGGWIRSYCNQQILHLTVTGNEERHAGGMIRVIWPSSIKGSPSQNQDILNRQMDGKYLVKSITHYFNPKAGFVWQQKLVLIKNGYKDSLNNELVKAKKVNL